MSKHTPGPWECCSASDGKCKCRYITSIGHDGRDSLLVANAVKAVPNHPVPNLTQATGIEAEDLTKILDGWFLERNMHPPSKELSKEAYDNLIDALLTMSTRAWATMDDDEDLPAPDNDEEFQANKKLIAAAPELFEACKLVFGIVSGAGIVGSDIETKLEAAIDKAENGNRDRINETQELYESL
jgi:hypothetical protein